MRTLLLATLSCLSVLPLAAPPATGGVVKVGDVVRHTFRTPPLNALGVERIEDLRGKPVLVACWGYRLTTVDDWVRDVLVWQKEYGDDLAVLLVDMQGASPETMEAAALRRKWLDDRAMWSGEYVAYTGLKGLPQFSLLSNEGVLLLSEESGMSGMSFVPRRMEEIEDAIAEQVRLRREGPPGIPSALSGAYRRFAAGEIGAAFSAARALRDDAKTTAAADAALTEFTRRLEQRFVRFAALLESGRLAQLADEIEGLAGELENEPDLRGRCEKILAALHSEENAPERAAAAALAKLEKKLAAKGPKPAIIRALGKLAKKHAGTKSAARAVHWVELASSGKS